MSRGRVAPLLVAVLCAAAQAGASLREQGGPLSPDEALAGFELEPGYRIELVAAEPLVKDPVAIAFDERGRLYVAENRGYPGPLEGSGPATHEGVIALLEDTDADGRFDERREFASGLTYPNGVMVWNGGVFVTSAPDLLYFKDTTGDGVADDRRVVLTGFDAAKTTQLRFSHPTLGLDNWVYLTSGLVGGRVTAPGHPERPPVEFAASDSRFNPFTLAFETVGGQGQYGLTFDDYGRRFICSNRHPVWHVVLEPRYLKRNPHLAFSQTVQEVSTVGPHAVVWPISEDMTTASFIPNLMSRPHAGTFTAASGLHVHRGHALPEGHEGSLFICESAQNLVQRQIRTPDGVTFRSRPARAGREFLASRDNWFRPVFAANGPDGALYIVDMYRKVIDHPTYVPEGSRALLDFEAGKERGRIYRVVAREWKAETRRIDLGRMSADELARLFERPNAWRRETAQRLLLERRHNSVVPLLRTLAASGRGGEARVHALWTLDGLGALAAADVGKALMDVHPPVRENAVRLAETRLAGSPELLSKVLQLAGDVDKRVRFQVALALGESDDAHAIDALASIARRDGADRWVRAATLSSAGNRAGDFLRSFVARQPRVDVRAAVMQDLGQLFGAGESPERNLELVIEVAAPAADFGWRPAALAGIARGLRARGLETENRSALMTLLSSHSPRARLARQRVDWLLRRASAAARNSKTSVPLRLAAIELLGHTSYAAAGETLENLLAPRHSSEIQVTAVRALLQLPGRDAAARLLAADRWPAFTPHVLDAALAALMAEERHVPILLDAVETGAVAAVALGPSARSRLMAHGNAAIRQRARVLFAALSSADRRQVYERLRPAVLARSGSPAKGRKVFESRCAACHTFGRAGGALGPDLSGIRNQPADAILLHALVPDYEITPGYEGYVVKTRDGRTLFGRLESETPNSLTLRDTASQQHVILRSQVVSLSASTTSLMPGELETGLSEQDLADLIAYLKAGATLPNQRPPR